MSIKYLKGDLFELARQPAILAHSCNCFGSWGAGIAAQFARRFPKANLIYQQHCHNSTPDQLIGTAFLIHTDPSEPGNAGKEGHIIACLFTSRGVGRRKDAPYEIVKNTDRALSDLHGQLEDSGMRTIDMPQINAGIFKVPWEDTEEVLKKHDEFDYNIYIFG